jgi:hypothetical protein
MQLCGLHGFPAELLLPVELQAVERPRDVSQVGSWQVPWALAAMLVDG